MSFFADLHIHSHYSRATAKNLNLENLHYWAQLKGLLVVGTGDFTHPAWVEEIQEKLVPAEPGLFALRQDLADPINKTIPEKCRGQVRFILSSEISNIYKKNDKTRKNHNVILMPGLDSVKRFNERLSAIGNIVSDGRPILGLDAKNLLEIMLEIDPDGVFIPAHIWTPWFSMLGSKSGFDSIEECFEDLSDHIFALETGLSSDPQMNWRVSNLDNRTLVSNSDAHSPAKLAREANIFDTDLNFPAMRKALETGKNFLGTIEFFPEEGKYHLDGHRKCGVCFSPSQSLACDCKCPECGRPLTLGVLHRVEILADRDKNQLPKKKHPFHSLVPLTDILSQIVGVGPTSKKVQAAYMELVSALGPELHILKDIGESELAKAPVPLLDIAISRMRSGTVVLNPGFDGEYGTVRVFEPQERQRLMGQQSLFNIKPQKKTKKNSIENLPKNPEKISQKIISPKPVVAPFPVQTQKKIIQTQDKIFPVSGNDLNFEQEQAIKHLGSPLLIKAGPGTGKTRTLTHRIAWLVNEAGADPALILAITFTNQAALEMRERLEKILDPRCAKITVTTFHSFGLMLLKEQAKSQSRTINVLGEKDRIHFIKQAMDIAGQKAIDTNTALAQICLAKQRLSRPEIESFSQLNDKAPAMRAIYGAYQDLLQNHGLVDFDDLLSEAVSLAQAKLEFRENLQKRFAHVCVDEYQDLNLAQYRLLRLMCPPGADLVVIGDPDQAIYGFRGSDVGFFNSFTKDYPDAKIIQLTRNYRSTETVLSVASQIMDGQGTIRLHSGIIGKEKITILENATSAAEAETIVHSIEKIMGGISHFSMDSGRVDDSMPDGSWGFGDFAVLYRVKRQAGTLAQAFDRSGIPYQIVDKKRLSDHPGVEEFLSYARLIHGTGTDMDFLRIVNFPKRGIGEKTIAALGNWARAGDKSLVRALDDARRLPLPGLSNSRQMRLHELWKDLKTAREITADMPLCDRLEYIIYNIPIKPLMEGSGNARSARACILDLARNFSGDMADFCDHVVLASDADTLNPKADRVSLMTMHAAKGLEFDGVFVTGCEDGLIPFALPGKTTDINEELRLFYVAVTRAKKRLWLSFAHRRRIFGKISQQIPSPFLKKIEEAIKDSKQPFASPKKSSPVQMGLDFG